MKWLLIFIVLSLYIQISTAILSYINKYGWQSLIPTMPLEWGLFGLAIFGMFLILSYGLTKLKIYIIGD